jgi:hypothetical protein
MESIIRRPLIFGSLMVLLAAGCELPDRAGEQVKPLFAIDLQTRFLHDSVRVEVNDATVFDDTVTTLFPGIVDLACRITPSVNAGYCRITVSISNLNLRADTTISVQDTTLLGVMLDRTTKRVSFEVFHVLLLYD